ncbi:MAG: AAA family ATPase [Desulfovibrionaceae bacterium]|nr:AAA family ATPase [Desulfovibrionaceae bacterium]
MSPREQLKLMHEFALNDVWRVGILYGLQRTGKSILLCQWLQSIPYEEQSKTAYISVGSERMVSVYNDLRILLDNGYKYIAINEITECEDFTDLSAPLANEFANYGMKLFITGDDSLALWFAMCDELFDRHFTIHTTHISFAEWSSLKNSTNLDDYIRHGGLLHLKPTLGERKYSAQLIWSEDNIENYFNSAIAKNIQHSILRYRQCISAGLLDPISEDVAMQTAIYGLFGNITRHEFINTLDVLSKIDNQSIMNAIETIVAHDLHSFSSNFVAKNFKLVDIARTANSLKNINKNLYNIIISIVKTLHNDAEKLLDIQTKIGFKINLAQFIELEKYLRCLEVFAMRPCKAFLPKNPTLDDLNRYHILNDIIHAQNIVVQPGLRFAQADIVRKLLKEQQEFLLLSNKDQTLIEHTYLNGVYGMMQEDIILYETMQQCKIFGELQPWNNRWLTYANIPIKAYKAYFPNDKIDEINNVDKEIDMVIECEKEKKFYLIEIKHSRKMNIQQSKWITDNHVLNRITDDPKNIASKTVLYRGKTGWLDDIRYINIYEYLMVLHNQGIKSALELLDDDTNKKHV